MFFAQHTFDTASEGKEKSERQRTTARSLVPSHPNLLALVAEADVSMNLLFGTGGLRSKAAPKIREVREAPKASEGSGGA